MAGLVACLLLMETPPNPISLSFWPKLLTIFKFSCMFWMNIANSSTTNPKHYLLWLVNNSYLDRILANVNINFYILDPEEPFTLEVGILGLPGLPHLARELQFQRDYYSHFWPMDPKTLKSPLPERLGSFHCRDWPGSSRFYAFILEAHQRPRKNWECT